ncbi:MAG: rod-binding protein [Alphaproteobacteria bacterium]
MDAMAAGIDMDSMKITNVNASKLAQMQKAKAAMRGVSEARIDEVAQEFEAQFIAQMMETMFATVPTNDAFGGGESEKIYESMVVSEYGKLIARTGGIGLADHVKREMIRLQEVE